jgi:hypothetical protein
MARIAWLVPYPLKGSGGHRTIFQKVAALHAAGHECHCHLEPPPPDASPRYSGALDGKRLVEDYFGPVPAKFHYGFELSAPVDLAFATAWFTAPSLRRSKTPLAKAYFVQDFEAAFQPMGDQYLLAESTLRFGFPAITIGRWLAMRLERDYGARAASFDFCADRSIYRPLDGERRERAICFLYQPDKPRRCSGLGSQALAIVQRLRPEIKIELYGYEDRLLTIEECNRLYNRCQLGLCISTTNPSRIPFEMMAAGLPVVDVYGENTRWDLPDSAIALAEPTAESIAHALLQLYDDEPRRARMSEAGRRFMADRDLSVGLAQFVARVEQLLAGAAWPADREEPLHRAPAVVAPPAEAERYRAELERAEASAPRSAPPGLAQLAARVRRRLSRLVR